MVVRFLLLCALAALMLVPAAPADGAVTRKKAMWGPVQFGGVSQIPVYADLGVGILQQTLHWDAIATRRPADARDPHDPAYVWPGHLDAAVAEARTYGIEISLAVYRSPGWANGGRTPDWAPTRPADFADFMEAASRRYPGIRHWMVWQEPTKLQNFRPLAADNNRPLRGRKLRGPRLYARMLDASYARLKAVSRRNLVIGGNTFTVGHVSPRRFIGAMRLPNGRTPRMDLWGHNPFSLRRPKLDNPPLGNGLADFSDLDQLARWLDRHFRGRKLRIFISEFTLPTDHANWQFNFYLDRRTQADWLRAALRITRPWRRIYTFGYLSLYDQEPRPDGDQVEWGLLTRSGERKPAYAAYRDG